MDDRESSLWFEGPLHDDVRPLSKTGARVACIPRRYWDCQLALIPDTTNHRTRIMSFASRLTSHISAGRGLVLYGAFGQGKTGAAVCLLKKAIAHGAYGLFVRALDLPDLEKSRSDHARETRERVRKQQVLLVDDLGSSRDNDFDQSHEILAKSLRHRYDNMRTTLITTNLTPVQLAAEIPSMKSIFASDYEHIICAGHDWRSA